MVGGILVAGVAFVLAVVVPIPGRGRKTTGGGTGGYNASSSVLGTSCVIRTGPRWKKACILSNAVWMKKAGMVSFFVGKIGLYPWMEVYESTRRVVTEYSRVRAVR